MRYSYRYDEDRQGRMNEQLSYEMDALRAKFAPTASQIRQRVLEQLAAGNGRDTRRVLPSGQGDE